MTTAFVPDVGPLPVHGEDGEPVVPLVFDEGGTKKSFALLLADGSDAEFLAEAPDADVAPDADADFDPAAAALNASEGGAHAAGALTLAGGRVHTAAALSATAARNAAAALTAAAALHSAGGNVHAAAALEATAGHVLAAAALNATASLYAAAGEVVGAVLFHDAAGVVRAAVAHNAAAALKAAADMHAAARDIHDAEPDGNLDVATQGQRRRWCPAWVRRGGAAVSLAAEACSRLVLGAAGTPVFLGAVAGFVPEASEAALALAAAAFLVALVTRAGVAVNAVPVPQQERIGISRSTSSVSGLFDYFASRPSH